MDNDLKLEGHYTCKSCGHDWKTHWGRSGKAWPRYNELKDACERCLDKSKAVTTLPYCLFLRKAKPKLSVIDGGKNDQE